MPDNEDRARSSTYDRQRHAANDQSGYPFAAMGREHDLSGGELGCAGADLDSWGANANDRGYVWMGCQRFLNAGHSTIAKSRNGVRCRLAKPHMFIGVDDRERDESNPLRIREP